MEVIGLFSGAWGALRFLAGFVVLPLLYLHDCIDVHKQVAEQSMKILPRSGAADETIRSLDQLRDTLYLFRLEWWLVGAITVFLLGVFLLGSVPAYSSRLGDPLTVGMESRVWAGGVIKVFGFGLAMAAVYFVRWKKVIIFRRLEEITRDAWQHLGEPRQ